MPNDAAFRSSVAWLAPIIFLVGFFTHYSFKKMAATYLFGMFAIGGVLLPDWDFLDRSISQWSTPLSVDHLRSDSAQTAATQTRFRFYPVRTVLYTVVYGFGLYKWWVFVSS